MVDDTKLHQFMGQMLSDLGGAASVASASQVRTCPNIKLCNAGSW
jgi:hypothetical protein